MSLAIGNIPTSKGVATAVVTKLVRGGPDETCWETTGSLRRGYGRIKIGGRTYPLHRVAWVLVHGQIPNGLVIDHLCRNRKCANVSHLRLVSLADNVLKNSESIPALNAVKTHCLRGHEFTTKNTYLAVKKGIPQRTYRRCRICSAMRARIYKAEKRTAPGGTAA